MNIIVRDRCTGPNSACRAAHRVGRPVHAYPVNHQGPALVLPTYHFETADQARTLIAEAAETAPTVTTDDDLHRFRAEGLAHFLPVGWIDPSRR